MSPATAAAAPVVQTTARAFGLKSIADSVASALEDRFARMLPQLEVQVVGFRGAFTGRLWWVASYYTVGAELRIVRADLSARELGDLPLPDVVNLVEGRIRAQIPGDA